jgi:hypothetical protein
MALNLLTYQTSNKFVVEHLRWKPPFLRQKRISTAEEPTTLDDLCWRLKHNELTKLKVGFGEENDDYLTSTRNAEKLERALRHNTSLRHVAIGWRHSSRDAMCILVRAVAKYTRLVSLQLILDDWLPESLLRLLVHNQATTLETLDIRCVQVLRRNPLGKLCCEITVPASYSESVRSTSTSSTRSSSQRGATKTIPDRFSSTCDHCIISRVLIQLRGSYFPRLKSLQLHDVGMQDSHAVMLADFLHIRGGLEELVVRSNRSLGPHGVSILCQAPITKTLDLSLCDMDPKTAAALAPAIAARSFPLGELLICGNYRMGTPALLRLFQPTVCRKLKAINISYCDINDHRVNEMLSALSSLDQSSRLERLIVNGSLVANERTATSWAQLLEKNLSPLRCIHMNDPKQPKIWSRQQLEILAEGLRNNYELEDLKFDTFFQSLELRSILSKIQFYLRLNQAGRRILLLRKNEGDENVDWFDVIARGGNDLDVTYWLVRHSGDLFEQRYRAANL